MASKIPRITAKRGNSQNSSKKINLSTFKGNNPKASRKNSICDIFSCYKDIPISEIDEVLYTEKGEEGDNFCVKFTDSSFHDSKIITRDEFKNYTNGEQIFDYFSNLRFRNSINPILCQEEKILKSITNNGKTIYLVKWFNLPIKYSTWEENVSKKAIQNFEREHIHLSPVMNPDYESIIQQKLINFSHAQSTVINSIAQIFFEGNYNRFALLGGIGSIMRKDVIVAAKIIREITYCNLPILFIVDEDLIPIVKTELQVNLGLIALSVNFDLDEISAIHENGWFYPGTSITKYTVIVISYEALPLMTDLLEQTEFLLVCADATSNKACLNTISNLLSDFVEGEEMAKPTDEKAQLELIEDYLKTSVLKSNLVISLLPFFLHNPTSDRFLDAYCEPSRLCQEEFLICKLTPEQRAKYDCCIYENMKFDDYDNLCSQDLINQLNLICDHPDFVDSNYDLSQLFENGTEKFTHYSGKLRILCEMIDKAIFEEKRTLIITSNPFLFDLLQKFFQVIEKPVEILDKENSQSEKKFQFVLCCMDHTDFIPWCSLELDWIFCLTPYINPIKHSSNWTYVLTPNFVLQKCTIFRFVVEDTHEVYLAEDEMSSDIIERPDIPYHVLLSYSYPLRLLSERSRIKPFMLRIHHPLTSIYMQEMAINSSAVNPSVNNETNAFIGDFEPCMLENANGIFVPTSTIVAKEQNHIKIKLKIKGAKDEKEKNSDSKESFKTHFLQYTQEKEQLEAALEIDYSDFNEDWSSQTIEALLHIISSVCWGNWELMTRKMPIQISPGTMKQAAYLLLDYILKITDREYKIAETFVSRFKSDLDEKSMKIILDNIIEYMGVYESNHRNDLNCRLDRIEDLMVLTMVLARSNVNNLPHDIYIPKGFYDSIPGPEWTDVDDREMLYMVYSNGYNTFSTNNLTHKFFASLSCRFHALIQAYIPEIPIITGCISPPPPSPNNQSQPSTPQIKTVKITLKRPKQSSTNSEKSIKKKPIWTNDEKKTFGQLIIDYGPMLCVNDFRSLIPLDEKSDQAIISLKANIIDYANNKSDAFESVISRESLESSLSFYDELNQINLDDYYYEDQAIIAAIKFWGLHNCAKSPLLRNMFDYVSEKAIRNEFFKLTKRKITDPVILKIKEKGLNSLNSTDHDHVYDTINGRLISENPINVAKGISIISIGHINVLQAFSNTDYIYPDGYSVSCIYNDFNVTCSIRNNGNGEPLFSVSMKDQTFSGRTPEEAWLKFMENQMKLPQYSFDLWRVPGHELFGLTSPLTKRLIQALPLASDTQYVPHFFRTAFEEIENIFKPIQESLSIDIETKPITLSQFYSVDDEEPASNPPPLPSPSNQSEEEVEQQTTEIPRPVTNRGAGKRGNITVRPPKPIQFNNSFKPYNVRNDTGSDSDEDKNDGGAFVGDDYDTNSSQRSTQMQTREKKEKPNPKNELVRRPIINSNGQAPFEYDKTLRNEIHETETDNSFQKFGFGSRRKRRRILSESAKIVDNIQPVVVNSQENKPKTKSELRFPFYKVMSKIGTEEMQMSFDSKQMFANLNPVTQPENYKQELKKLGNSLLSHSEVRSMLGFNEQINRSSATTTANVTDSEI